MGPQHWMVRFVRDFWVLTLLILLAVNSLLVLGVQGLAVYRYELPEVISAGEYAGSQVLDQINREGVQIFLLKKPDGTVHTVTLEPHIMTGKFRLVRGGSRAVEEDDYRKVVLADSGMITLKVRGRTELEADLSPLGLRIKNFTLPYSYIGWSLLLLVIEATIYWQLRRILGKEA